VYYRGVLENEAARRGVGLWGRLSPHKPFDVVLAAGAIVLLVLALRARPTHWELVAFVLLVAATLDAARNGVWLVLALAPRAALGLPQREGATRRLAPAAGALGAAVVLAALARGPGSTGATAALVQRTVAAAHGSPVLAADVLAEQVALAGGRVWVGNPIDAFSRRDQTIYLDWLDGSPKGDAALTRVRVALVGSQSAPERELAHDPSFVRVAADARATLFVRRSSG
jgi:hypothetical protein